ncbi:MAG: two-component system LytT family response regulator [Marivirga sp.]|jgi:two-component system LytT family response regulator
MKKLKCLIVDDEPLASAVIKRYVENTPFLSLQATFENGWQLQDYLTQNKVDLLFLDIQMPGLDGLTFMKTNNTPAVIFITAHREYAVEAFELAATDYLLKPVSYDRFLSAVNKVSTAAIISAPAPNEIVNSVYVLVDRQMKRLLFAEILYLEAQGDYIKIFLENAPILLTKKTLREMIESLPPDMFFQIHRSFVVNKQHISAYTNDKLQVKDKWLKISRSFKGGLNF